MTPRTEYYDKNIMEVTEKLEKLGIKRLKIKETEEPLKEMTTKNLNTHVPYQQEMTLFVQPPYAIENETYTKALLRRHEVRIRRTEQYCRYDEKQFTNEVTHKWDCITYFPEKNLVIVSIPILQDKDIFEYFVGNLNDLQENKVELKYYEEGKYHEEKRIEETIGTLKEEKDRLLGLVIESTETMNDLRERYYRKKRQKEKVITDIEQLETLIQDFRKIVKERIEKAKTIPIVENIELKNGLMIKLKPIRIRALVKTGEQTEKGIRVPTEEWKDVYIGKLQFCIQGPKDYEVHNLDNEFEQSDGDTVQHPHAINNTQICLGESDIDIYVAAKEWDIERLVNLLYSWATSYNPEDKYVAIQHFYDLEKKKEKETLLVLKTER